MRAPVATIDFETGARLPLKTVGVARYTECPEFRVNCLSYSLDGTRVASWLPGCDPPRDLCAHVAAGYDVEAHNAAFEYAAWRWLRLRDPRWPELRLEQLSCTMAAALALSLPAGLDDLCAALGIGLSKYAPGRKTMMRLAKPLRDGTWASASLDELHALLRYCEGDVRAEMAVSRAIQPLTPMQRHLWLINERINQRGVALDTELIDKAIQVADLEAGKSRTRLAELTNGAVQTVNQRDALLTWLAAHGVMVDGLRAADVTELLSRDDLPDIVRDVLLTRQEGAKASVAKLRAMRASACADGRARGLLLYHGAGTGRASSKRIQVQNMPRQPDDFDFEDVSHALSSIS